MDAFERFRLDGKVAVVTGASSGLGVTFALGLAAAGADVVLGARRIDKLEETRAAVEAEGRRCLALATDVTRYEDCAALIAAARDTFGNVEILVNNAGVGQAAPAHKEDPAEFEKILQINLTGTYHMAHAFGVAAIAAGHGGSIINITSVLGLGPSDIPQAGYAASKAGMIGLTRDLAMQWTGRRGIRVNAIAPSFFRSELTGPLLDSEVGLAKVLAGTPMGRIGEPEELIGPLLLLASDAGSYMTGATIAVDGGWSMH